MSYVLVTADFPRVTSDQRKIIYACLEKKNWKKIHEPGRDIDTVWEGFFETQLESQAIDIAIENFDSCSKPYCRPKLVIHWGPNKPTCHGLV